MARDGSPSRIVFSDGYAIKVKESDKVKFGPFPTIATLKQWKTDVYTSVLAASGRSDTLVVSWLRRAEEPAITFEQLGQAPLELVTIDQKLSHALLGICKGEFERTVALKHEERIQRENRPISGPQMFWLILGALPHHHVPHHLQHGDGSW